MFVNMGNKNPFAFFSGAEMVEEKAPELFVSFTG